MSATQGSVGARDQPLLSAVAAGSVFATIPVVFVAGYPQVVVLPAIVAAGAMTVFRRDSPYTLAGLAIVISVWATSGAPADSPWAFVVAALVLSAHAAVALRDSIPPGARLERALVRRWLVRSATVLEVTALVYLFGVLTIELGVHDDEAEIALVFLLVLALALVLRHETLRPGEGSGR
jgi:hypothetical protein